MARISPLVLLPPVLFAGLAGLFAQAMWQGDSDELPSAIVGQVAPAVPMLELADLPPLTQGALADGEVKLVNFFASWCAPCRVEHPHLTALAAEGLPIYGIAYKDDPEDAAAFLAELGDPYAAAGQDPEGRAALDWGVYGVPETFVVAGDGTVIARIAGPVTSRALDDRLRPALEEAAR